jgi:hypothetical protein
MDHRKPPKYPQIHPFSWRNGLLFFDVYCKADLLYNQWHPKSTKVLSASPEVQALE